MTAPTTLLTIVVPAKDEEAGLGETLRRIPRKTLEAMGFAAEVLVLDGNSQDRTAEVARQAGATVVVDREPGKGAALRHARPLVTGRFAVMLDADGSYPPDAIPRVVEALAAGAPVVMGRRRPQPGAMSPAHVVGNAALSALATLLYGRRCPDLCTGLWGFRTEVLQELPLRSQRFGLEAELFAMACRRRHPIAWVDVDYLPRRGYPKLRLARDGVRILRRLVRSRFSSMRTRPQATTTPAPVVVPGRKGAA